MKQCFSFVLLPLIVLLHFSACSAQSRLEWAPLKKEIRSKFPTVKHISTEDLAVWLDSADSTKPVLLDVRNPEEFAVSHLKNAKLSASEKQAFKAIQNLESNHPIVVYCSVGYRSSRLAAKLQARGFKNVRNLEGSIFQWANEGRPVYSKEDSVRQVHPYDNQWGQLLNKELWIKKK